MNNIDISHLSFSNSVALLKRVLLVQFIFLLLMSSFRILFYFQFSASTYPLTDLINAFILGIRLDAIVIGYIQAPLTIFIIILWLVKKPNLIDKSKKYISYYLFLFYIFASYLIAIDFGYFSFFNEHTTLMVYGVLDDDTAALWETMKANYNIVLISIFSFIYITILFLTIQHLTKKRISGSTYKLNILIQLFFIIFIIFLNIIIVRGTFGLQPLSKMTPDISKYKFINELSNNGVLAFIKATKLYKKSKSGNYNLIKSTHYEGKINQAFSYLTSTNVDINSNYIKSITYTVPNNNKIERLQPHVVVVMVESFGLPITRYQSNTFNILGRLKKHFDEDTLFTNFISASNGTIVSLEPTLLNITARPNSTSIGQSKYQYTSFSQAAAKVYEKAGYETTFVYGGDLKWRNVGKFMSKQGFQTQVGKMDIASSLDINPQTSSHDWGLFDQYSYDYVIKLLKNSKKPQFIFLLTTNNHPPFKIPKSYKSNSLIPSASLKKKMVGDEELIQKRLYDYQYALDMAGKFMDNIKSSKLKDKTVVAITADNNTIEGRIRYKDPITTSKKIPLYIYAPKSIRKQNTNTLTAGSHKDLFATLYNQTLSNVNYISVGKNLFNNNIRHCGFNDSGIIMSNDGAFQHKKAKSIIQKECDKEYDSALAVSDWLIRIYPKLHIKE